MYHFSLSICWLGNRKINLKLMSNFNLQSFVFSFLKKTVSAPRVACLNSCAFFLCPAFLLSAFFLFFFGISFPPLTQNTTRGKRKNVAPKTRPERKKSRKLRFSSLEIFFSFLCFLFYHHHPPVSITSFQFCLKILNVPFFCRQKFFCQKIVFYVDFPPTFWGREE